MLHMAPFFAIQAMGSALCLEFRTPNPGKGGGRPGPSVEVGNPRLPSVLAWAGAIHLFVEFPSIPLITLVE